ncbi:hypothetical protein QRN89_00830 [Streptomyces chengbuensis]|uniref:hypothetical protein n=1 Tax=Streptomyces TaxID=1883 RepID=UPI0025B3AAB0|nr:hypothetical protein [Streptomyces sp. HUAS CB01]WJY48474.1 hypothetical protein QRN89_00830 [Streptomyces sp. HUAS CB01]
MEQREVMKRVVAVLTEAAEVHRRLVEDPERQDLEDEKRLMGEMVSETLGLRVRLSADAEPAAVARAVHDAMEDRTGVLASCFVTAFLRLAEYHDSGRTDVSSADVLRELALEWGEERDSE